MNVIKKLKIKISKYGIRYVVTFIIKNKIYILIDQVIFWISKRLFENETLKNSIIIESHNDFDSNGGALYEYLIENN